MVWQGLSLFIDPANPTGPGRVSVIYERAEEDRKTGLRVHCDGWSSDMAPIEVKDFNWYRLKIRIERTSETQGRVYAKIWNTETREPDQWMIETDLPTTAALNRTAMAVATSAQYGYERNPRVAFGEVSVNSNRPVDTTSLQVADRDAIVADHFKDLVVYMDKFPQSRGGFDNREMVYEEIIEQTDRLAANYPEYADLLKAKRAKMRALGAKGHWDEFDGIANALEQSPVLREKLADHSALKEREVSEKYNNISRKFKERKFEEIKPEIEQFMADHPNDPRTPELHRVLCHSLFGLRGKENARYWEVTQDFVDRQVIPDQVDDILLNQAYFLLKQGEFDSCFNHIDLLVNEYPTTDLFLLALMMRMDAWVYKGDVEFVLNEGQVVIDQYGDNSYEAAMAHVYMAYSLAIQPIPPRFDEALAHIEMVLAMDAVNDFVGDDHLPTYAASYKSMIGRMSNTPELVEEALTNLQEMPDSREKRSAINNSLKFLENENVHYEEGRE